MAWRAHVRNICYAVSLCPTLGWTGDHSICPSSRSGKSGKRLRQLQHNGLLLDSAKMWAESNMDLAVELAGRAQKFTQKLWAVKVSSRSVNHVLVEFLTTEWTSPVAHCTKQLQQHRFSQHGRSVEVASSARTAFLRKPPPTSFCSTVM